MSAADEFPAELLNARVQFWMCLNRDHKSVVWAGDVATCPDCGLTSEMTKRFAARLRVQIAKEIEAYAENATAEAVNDVIKDKPGGFSGALRASAIAWTAKFVRGEVS